MGTDSPAFHQGKSAPVLQMKLSQAREKRERALYEKGILYLFNAACCIT